MTDDTRTGDDVHRPALVELRRYRLHPGRRDDLIALFDAELRTTQEDVGLQVLGQYRDDAEPDHFVWLRGYPTDDPQERASALTRFYHGPVWAAHRDAANATMLDSDDVLLLRPARPDLALCSAPGDAQALSISTCLLARPLTTSEIDAVAEALPGALAILVTADVENAFPGLPVRDEQALVWVSRDQDPGRLPPVAEEAAIGPVSVAHLQPTALSRALV